MKMMKWFMAVLVAVALLAPSVVQAQSNKVTGKMKIDFLTRQGADIGTPAGTEDKYSIDVIIGGNQKWVGDFTALPPKPGEVLAGKQGSLTAKLSIMLLNSKTAQWTPVANWYGAVPIDGKNIYRFDQGTMCIAKLSDGTSGSKFRGVAVGKPFKASLLDRAKQKAEAVRKQVKGQVLTLTVTNYDKMVFNATVIAGGPIDLYPESTVSGTMLYDADRAGWYPNLTVSYTPVRGAPGNPDTIGGTILWVSDPQQGSTRTGRYIFDVRVNEPVADESKTVEAVVLDEDAFFASDSTATALVGTMSYTDQLNGEGTTLSSEVVIDLTANGLTKVQQEYLSKILLGIIIVPMNND